MRAKGGGLEADHRVGGRGLDGAGDIAVHPFGEAGRGERHPEVTVLGWFVDDADDIGVAGMGRMGGDGAVSQGACAELHAIPEPGDDASGRDETGDFRIDVLVAENHVAVGCAGLSEGVLGFIMQSTPDRSSHS